MPRRSFRSLDPVARSVTEMFMAGPLPRPAAVIGVLAVLRIAFGVAA